MDNLDFTGNDIQIFGRTRAEISGVDDVVGFSDSNVTLKCKGASLSLDGEGLKIESFDSSSGHLSVTGRVDALMYYCETGVKSRRRFFG